MPVIEEHKRTSLNACRIKISHMTDMTMTAKVHTRLWGEKGKEDYFTSVFLELAVSEGLDLLPPNLCCLCASRDFTLYKFLYKSCKDAQTSCLMLRQTNYRFMPAIKLSQIFEENLDTLVLDHLPLLTLPALRRRL